MVSKTMVLENWINRNAVRVHLFLQDGFEVFCPVALDGLRNSSSASISSRWFRRYWSHTTLPTALNVRVHLFLQDGFEGQPIPFYRRFCHFPSPIPFQNHHVKENKNASRVALTLTLRLPNQPEMLSVDHSTISSMPNLRHL